MPDDDVLESYSVPEIYVTRFVRHRVEDGNMTCIGIRKMPSGDVPVVRLTWPATNTADGINEANAAMNSTAQPVVSKRTKPGVH